MAVVWLSVEDNAKCDRVGRFEQSKHSGSAELTLVKAEVTKDT